MERVLLGMLDGRHTWVRKGRVDHFRVEARSQDSVRAGVAGRAQLLERTPHRRARGDHPGDRCSRRAPAPDRRIEPPYATCRAP
jgi:hypothetical protein